MSGGNYRRRGRPTGSGNAPALPLPIPGRRKKSRKPANPRKNPLCIVGWRMFDDEEGEAAAPTPEMIERQQFEDDLRTMRRTVRRNVNFAAGF